MQRAYLNKREFGELTTGVLVEVYSSSGGTPVVGLVQKVKKYGGEATIAIVVDGRHFDMASCKVYLRPPEGLDATELRVWRLNEELRSRQFEKEARELHEALHFRGSQRIFAAAAVQEKVTEVIQWGFVLTTELDTSVHSSVSEDAARQMVETHEATGGSSASLTKRTIRTVTQTGFWEEAE